MSEKHENDQNPKWDLSERIEHSGTYDEWGYYVSKDQLEEIRALEAERERWKSTAMMFDPEGNFSGLEYQELLEERNALRSRLAAAEARSARFKAALVSTQDRLAAVEARVKGLEPVRVTDRLPVESDAVFGLVDVKHEPGGVWMSMKWDDEFWRSQHGFFPEWSPLRRIDPTPEPEEG